MLDCGALAELVERGDAALFHHLQQCLRCDHRVVQCAVTVSLHFQSQTLAHNVQVVAEFGGINVLTEAHGAETFGKLGVSPAELLFALQKPVIELRVVRDKRRSLRKIQKLREYDINSGRMCNVLIADMVDLLGFLRDITLGIHEREECLLGNNQSVHDFHTRDFDDPVASPGIQSGCLNVENGECGQGHGEAIVVGFLRTPNAKPSHSWYTVSLSAIPLETALKTLRETYKPPRTFLHFRTPLDLLVATILSAQCTDKRVNIVTQTLYRKYQTPQDYVNVSRQELEDDIHSCGTYRNKARYLQEMCGMLIDKHQGHVPQTMEELTELPGVGRKTAAIILWACFGKNEGIAVDTHVLRVSKRLGLTTHTEQGKVERDLMKGLPSKDWGYLTTLLISHGRAVCTARNRACDKCVFQKDCPSSRTRNLPDLAKQDKKSKSFRRK